MFAPSLIGREEGGVHDMVYNSIMKGDRDIRNQLYSNIVIAGGACMATGFEQRLLHEIKKLAPANMTPNVIAHPDRRYATWIGGSLLASLSSFQSQWVTRAEYDEHGPCITHRKCF